MFNLLNYFVTLFATVSLNQQHPTDTESLSPNDMTTSANNPPISKEQNVRKMFLYDDDTGFNNGYVDDNGFNNGYFPRPSPNHHRPSFNNGYVDDDGFNNGYVPRPSPNHHRPSPYYPRQAPIGFNAGKKKIECGEQEAIGAIYTKKPNASYIKDNGHYKRRYFLKRGREWVNLGFCTKKISYGGTNKYQEYCGYNNANCDTLEIPASSSSITHGNYFYLANCEAPTCIGNFADICERIPLDLDTTMNDDQDYYTQNCKSGLDCPNMEKVNVTGVKKVGDFCVGIKCLFTVDCSPATTRGVKLAAAVTVAGTVVASLLS